MLMKMNKMMIWLILKNKQIKLNQKKLKWKLIKSQKLFKIRKKSSSKEAIVMKMMMISLLIRKDQQELIEYQQEDR